MELVFDSLFLEWLSNWSGEFEWDLGNFNKNEKHGIDAAQIETIFDMPVYVAGKIIGTDLENRWLLLGETDRKGWSLVVTVRSEKLRVISCRRQRKREALFYEKNKQESEG